MTASDLEKDSVGRRIAGGCVVILSLGLLAGCAAAGPRSTATAPPGTASPSSPAGAQGAPVTTTGPYTSLTPGTLNRVCDGVQVDLATAAEVAPFTLLVPAHALANASNLLAVWWCPLASTVGMEFSSGIIVKQRVNDIEDPVAEFNDDAESYSNTSVGVVRGQPAELVDPELPDDIPPPDRGAVALVEEGVFISVQGNGVIPLLDLIAVTESMKPVIGLPTPTP